MASNEHPDKQRLRLADLEMTAEQVEQVMAGLSHRYFKILGGYCDETEVGTYCFDDDGHFIYSY